MKIQIVGISPVRNRDFGKDRELHLGEARVNMISVRVIPATEAERMTVAELTAPPTHAKIEILWHDHSTLEHYRKWIREHPEHELLQ